MENIESDTVLSNASPIESSMVLPKMMCWPTWSLANQSSSGWGYRRMHHESVICIELRTPLVSTAMLCPPDTSNLAASKGHCICQTMSIRCRLSQRSRRYEREVRHSKAWSLVNFLSALPPPFGNQKHKTQSCQTKLTFCGRKETFWRHWWWWQSGDLKTWFCQNCQNGFIKAWWHSVHLERCHHVSLHVMYTHLQRPVKFHPLIHLCRQRADMNSSTFQKLQQDWAAAPKVVCVPPLYEGPVYQQLNVTHDHTCLHGQGTQSRAFRTPTSRQSPRPGPTYEA